MTWYIPDIILQAARDLRKNMTPAEISLWEELKQKKLWHKFLRQKPIFLYEEQAWFERYIIPDFVCLTCKIIVEIDGSIHENREVYSLDREKEMLLLEKWYKVLRFTNNEVNSDFKAVVNRIAASLI